MLYIKPHYYDKFKCIAGRCPATCCAGWQIVIDENSQEKYAAEKGDFGQRLKNSIDWTEGVFFQKDRRCAFLNDANLCDLYQELGAEALCETCRRYPRHIEEYEGIREYSLSLSCPIAAEIIMKGQEKVEFLETEDDQEDDFEEFDYLLFSQLEDVRKEAFRIIQDRSQNLRLRMNRILDMAKDMQNCLEEGRFFSPEDSAEREYKDIPVLELFARRKRELAVYEELEILQEEWEATLQKAKAFYEKGAHEYELVYGAFHRERGCESSNREAWECIGEQLLMFFVYTYFCGAVYDDQVYGKMALSVFAVLWIQELMMLCWMREKEDFCFESMVRTAYCYAREVEHSDENLECLEEWLIETWKGEI